MSTETIEEEEVITETTEKEEEVVVNDVSEEEEEVISEEKKEEEEEVKSEEDELEEAFAQFKKETSEHKFTEAVKEEERKVISKMNENDEFLISMFSGMFFSLCDGLHGFVLNFFSKHKLDSEAIELTEPQKKGLEVYFKTERVIKFLNKLSPELLGFVHMEWLYFQNMKAYNKKMDEKIEAEAEARKKLIADDRRKTGGQKKKKKRKKKKVVKPNEG